MLSIATNSTLSIKKFKYESIDGSSLQSFTFSKQNMPCIDGLKEILILHNYCFMNFVLYLRCVYEVQRSRGELSCEKSSGANESLQCCTPRNPWRDNTR